METDGGGDPVSEGIESGYESVQVNQSRDFMYSLCMTAQPACVSDFP